MKKLQQVLEKLGADAHCIYIEESSYGYAVLDLDEACDDLTNTNAVSEPLYSIAKIQAALESVRGEPFGHFRALPFGWAQCAESDEGAIALYERPAPGGVDHGR